MQNEGALAREESHTQGRPWSIGGNKVQPHHLCSKAVEEFLQRVSLILSYVKEIIRDRWGSLIRNVLCPE